MTTLVERLRAVDNIPDFVNTDKKQELRKVLDEARRDYPLVDKAARRDISFSNIIEELYKKHKSWRLLLPRLKDKGYDKKLDELQLDGIIHADGFRTDSQKIFSKENSIFNGYSGQFLGWFYDKIANPVVLPLLMGGFVAFNSGGQGRFESEIANYSAHFGVGALAGLVVGLIATMMKYQQISIPREQTKYLVAKIDEAYRS